MSLSRKVFEAVNGIINCYKEKIHSVRLDEIFVLSFQNANKLKYHNIIFYNILELNQAIKNLFYRECVAQLKK